MISSKALMAQMGISRATLNNYIQLGILPKPILRPEAGGDARQLGYFPEDVMERLETVRALKGQGLSMAEIAQRISETDSEIGEGLADEMVLSASSETSQGSASFKTSAVRQERRADPSLKSSLKASMASRNVSLSLESFEYPAYMLNYQLELVWFNELARTELFKFERLPDESAARNLLQLISRAQAKMTLADQRSLAGLYLKLASARVHFDALSRIVEGADPELLPLLTEIARNHQLDDCAIKEVAYVHRLADNQQVISRVYAVYFREGILIVHAPDQEQRDDLLDFLSRRDQVIQNLLSKRLPVMTPLAVIVADLQHSVRICSELPPDEYFALINQIWSAMSPILRKYSGTYGKHVGDGVVYYFFPQPESNYLFNALTCAAELRTMMQKISAEWQIRKRWFTELQLNIGIHEGQEWLGTFQSANHIEFAVLGNTINQAARLSDFARHGSIWASKNLISKLSEDERSRVEFGVLRTSQDNGDRFITSIYAPIESLVDLQNDKYEKLRDIAQLAVTEIKRVSPSRLY